MIDKKASSGAGEFLGSRLEGGERHPLGPGDIIHIPATIPHAFLVAKGKHITYVLVKFPARSSGFSRHSLNQATVAGASVPR